MVDLKKDLDSFFENQEEIKKHANELSDKADTKIAEFMKDKVAPAFEEIKTELSTRGRKVETHISKFEATIIIKHGEKVELDFAIELNKAGGKAHAHPREKYINRKDGKTFISEGTFRSGAQDFSTEELMKDELVKYIIERYKDSLESILLFEISESK